MKRSSVIGIIVFGVILVAVVAGFAFSLSHRKEVAEADTQPTPVQKVLMRDLERNYPPTPKEVVKYFADITQCFYNEELPTQS